tara:strand:- start:55 stop:2547 length:2493 start_codon:yes stop_codon:yes gene_type:complete
MTKKKHLVQNDRIQITVLGGGREIGANSYLLQWGDANILLDAGQDPQSELSDALVPIHRVPDDLDAMIITHGHFDHIGSLPFIFSNRNPKKIISQKFSCPIIEQMTESTINYMKNHDQDSQKYAYSKSYTFFNVKELKKLMRETSYPYGHEFKVTDKINGFFFNAGHILGSSSIVLSDGDYTFAYTGDIALKDHGIHRGVDLPKMKNLDCLMIESTTSSEENTINEEEQWNYFFDKINDAYERKSRILIPAFALGRSQDVVALIGHGKRTGKIQQDIPVHLVGSGNRISKIYEKYKDELRQEILPKSLSDDYKVARFDDIQSIYKSYVRDERTAIIVATNGMMGSGSPAAVMASNMVHNPNETIIFSGYQAPTTLGYEVLNSKTGSIVDFGEDKIENIQINTPHIYQIRMSGHGSKADMVTIANTLGPKNIGVIHGSPSSVDNLIKDLKNNHTTVLGPEKGETLLLRTPDDKSMRAKSDIKAQIITVGTSLLVNFKNTQTGEQPTVKNLVEFLYNNKDNSKACSAEIQTMNGIDIKMGDYLYFISSGDEDGLMCGEALTQAYNQFGYYSKNIPIPGLTKNYDSFKKYGLPQFIQAIVNVIESHGNNANIIATGGFKAETAYAAMVGSLTQVSVYYIHEDFQNVIELPGLPVGLDFSAWTTYFNTIEFILMQNKIKKAREIIDTQLPSYMNILFDEDEDLKQIILTPIGQLVKRLHSEYILSQEQIMTLMCGAKRKHLWGTGNIKIKEIPNKEIRLILERFQMHQAFIREIRIGKILAETSKQNLIKFHHRENEKVFYHLLTPNGGQEIIITTYFGVEKELVNRVGKIIQV